MDTSQYLAMGDCQWYTRAGTVLCGEQMQHETKKIWPNAMVAKTKDVWQNTAVLEIPHTGAYKQKNKSGHAGQTCSIVQHLGDRQNLAVGCTHLRKDKGSKDETQEGKIRPAELRITHINEQAVLLAALQSMSKVAARAAIAARKKAANHSGP
jgi:hypothetical protein